MSRDAEGEARKLRKRRRGCRARNAAWIALAASLVGCGDASPPVAEPEPPARGALGYPGMLEAIRADVERPRSPGDGGGRAWLPAPAPALRAGDSARFELVYEAGEHGIDVGGFVMLQVSPYWGWSEPQTTDPDAPGYTTAVPEADGVTLSPDPRGQHLLAFRVGGRALTVGERVRIVYGAGDALARVDRYSEDGERIWIAVDADGDGALTVLPDSPEVDIAPGEAAWLLASLPATARPGETVQLTLAAIDESGNGPAPLAGPLRIAPVPGLRLPSEVALGAADAVRIPVAIDAPGTYWLQIAGPNGLGARTNPLRVDAAKSRIWFGDLHGHSHYSDGTGTPAQWFRYARDIAGVDFAALTDHDHWGLPSLDERPDLWEDVQAQVAAFHTPGRFVTMLGFEWTSWVYGHRHVLRFADRGPLLSWIDRETETPEQLWAALRAGGGDVLTFAHHSAGDPVATDWTFPPDPVLEPVTEIVSVHGSSESADTPFPIEAARAGNHVRDALARGFRLGFVGSRDSHDGHPGLQRNGGSDGLAAVIAPELTREAILAALRARRCYATNGPRILLETELAGAPMGATLASTAVPAGSELRIEVLSPGPIERVEVVRGEEVVALPVEPGSEALELVHEVEAARAGETLYVRVVIERDGAAWSSPYFFD